MPRPVIISILSGFLFLFGGCVGGKPGFRSETGTPALELHAGLIESSAWKSDNGDGTYTNPPLYADYPDPDIIRVGHDFYFSTTTFANSPGLTILHSRDLVNWDLVTHVIPRLDGREEYDLNNGTAYRKGVYATSLRHHEGMFYIAVTPVDQNTRIYYSNEIDGPWNYHELDVSAFDPALFFDTDGKAYIATSGGWDGTITLHTLNDEVSRIVDSAVIHFNKGAEGSKLIKRGEWYYLFNAIPSKLAMTVSRAENLFGPWETRDQIDGRTGGHQGALVDLPDGSWYGFVMRDAGAIGRVTNISPIFWEDDWPVWGTKQSPGSVPAVAVKPIQGKPFMEPPTSDEFDSKTLGLQWQWNHNPDDTRWSLEARPGFLRLHAASAESFWTARNTLTQKAQAPWSRGEVRLDIGNIKEGDMCGFGTLGKFSGYIAVTASAGGEYRLQMTVMEDTAEGQTIHANAETAPFNSRTLYLRTDMDFQDSSGTVSLAYRFNGGTWESLGEPFTIAFDWRTGTFQGNQYAIFCYNPGPAGGYLDVDSFRFFGLARQR